MRLPGILTVAVLLDLCCGRAYSKVLLLTTSTAPPHSVSIAKYRSEERTSSQSQQQNIDNGCTIGGRLDRGPAGRSGISPSTVKDRGSAAKDQGYNAQSPHAFSCQRGATPYAGCVEDVETFGQSSNSGDLERGSIGDLEGSASAATMRSSSTALPSPCHSVRSRSSASRRHQLAEPRSRQEVALSRARGERLAHRSGNRAKNTLGVGATSATDADRFLLRREDDNGGSNGHDGAGGGGHEHGEWSGTSGIDPCFERSRSNPSRREGGLVSTPKNGDGRAAAAAAVLGHRGLDWETLLGSSLSACCSGENRSHAIAEALARAESLARWVMTLAVSVQDVEGN